MKNIMMHYKGDEDFVKKYVEIMQNVENQHSIFLTTFLTPHQQAILHSLIGAYRDLKIEFYGGIVNAESMRAIIAPDYYEITKSDYQIDIINVKYAKKFDTINHSDILGALMSLGIKREFFGDIVISDDAYFVCDSKITSLLQTEMNSIKRSTVRLKVVDIEIENKIEYTTKTFFVKSLRLDILLSHLYKLSRSEANRYIQAGFIKVNHKEVVENSFLCNNNDVISFKKHGRVKIVDTNGKTRQQNHIIEGYFYK